MRSSIQKGFSFGLTSGIITTLGMIVGLHSGTHSKQVVLGGIMVIAVADALSDAMGMHVSEESTTKKGQKHVWEATICTFLAKLVFALTFAVPIILFSLNTAIIVSVIWGLSLIAIFSYYIAKKEKMNPIHVISEHIVITALVIIITHYVGDFVATLG